MGLHGNPTVIVATLAMGSALVAVAGIGYLIVAGFLTARFARRATPGAGNPNTPAISVLKPLYGREPQLVANLASFLDQPWPAPIQLIGGVANADDAAVGAIAALRDQFPAAHIDLTINRARHGSNAKISNLANMTPAIRHEIVVLSDSDIAAPAGYYQHVVDALSAPGVGVVTCLYRGRGDAGFWSELAAAQISYQFLPNVLVSLALNAGGACMGSTIALRQDTLQRIGGFARFADVLADDHAIGVAVRDLGLSIAVPPIVVVHASTEHSFAALARQELRWAATIRDLRPWGYLGTAITMPLPFALLCAAIRPGIATIGIVVASLMSRLVLSMQIDRLAGAKTAPYAVMPLRELLSFGIFIASFFVRTVDWRGNRLAMIDDGQISAKPGMPA